MMRLSTDPLITLTGRVTSIEASGGSAASNLFQFHVNGQDSSAHPADASFELYGSAPASIFAAMADIVTASYFAKTDIQVLAYDRHHSGVYVASVIRPA